MPEDYERYPRTFTIEKDRYQKDVNVLVIHLTDNQSQTINLTDEEFDRLYAVVGDYVNFGKMG